jgi:hypothetical protein
MMQWCFNVLKGDSLITFENSKSNFNNHPIAGSWNSNKNIINSSVLQNLKKPICINELEYS